MKVVLPVNDTTRQVTVIAGAAQRGQRQRQGYQAHVRHTCGCRALRGTEGRPNQAGKHAQVRHD